MAIEYGAFHLADKSRVAAYQPVRKNNFRFYIDLTLADNENITLIKPGTDTEINRTLVRDVLDFSVVSFNAPHFKQEDVQIKRGNSTIYYAGLPSFDEGSLKINDFIGADGKSILEAWLALSYNIEDDTIASSDKYKLTAQVFEFSPDNTLVRHWDLYGCWVKSLSEDDWDAESGDKKAVTATIRFDKAVPYTDQ